MKTEQYVNEIKKEMGREKHEEKRKNLNQKMIRNMKGKCEKLEKDIYKRTKKESTK